jgi:sodium/bile acid cotransporter 7
MKLSYLDPFLIGLLLVVLIASVFPASGAFADVVKHLSTAAIVLLFFLHGAKLSSAAILAGIANWRLHLAVMVTTFVLFPVLGLAAFRLASYGRNRG